MRLLLFLLLLVLAFLSQREADSGVLLIFNSEGKPSGQIRPSPSSPPSSLSLPPPPLNSASLETPTDSFLAGLGWDGRRGGDGLSKRSDTRSKAVGWKEESTGARWIRSVLLGMLGGMFTSFFEERFSLKEGKEEGSYSP